MAVTFVWPSSNEEYWRSKIIRNVERDRENSERLKDMGWKVITVWKCELKKKVFEQTLKKLIEEIRQGGYME